MLTGPSDLGYQDPNNLGYDGRFSFVHMGEEAATSPQPPDAPRGWERREVQEMRQARRVILRAALNWALLAAGPCALLGLGLGFLLDAPARRLHPGWTAPHFLVNLALGALGGALGAALAGSLTHWLFEEHKDFPVVGGCAATLVVVAGGIYGAGLGGIWSTLAGLAVAVPVGFAGGVAAYFAYWTLKVTLQVVLSEVKGY